MLLQDVSLPQTAVKLIQQDPTRNVLGVPFAMPGTSKPDVSIPNLSATVVPPSPYGAASDICYSGNSNFAVEGYPGTPKLLTPFTRPFKNPPVKQSKACACRDDQHCGLAFELDVTRVQLPAFEGSVDGCTNTWHMAYDGSVPGPTLIAPV